MRLVISFAALFLSVILLQVSSGGVGPLDALTGIALGFSSVQIGLLGSAHFAGFFIGCWWAPRLMGSVGYNRAFAAFTALGAIGLLGHTLSDHPTVWAALRIASGLCIAGCYTVIEAWMHGKVENTNRGRAMGTYRFVDLGASLMAQLMIGVLADVETYLAYNTLTLLCCACLLPITLTRTEAPVLANAPRLRPALALALSPLAVGGVLVSGLTTAAYRMVGPLYGAEVGLTPAQIGVFLAALVAGGALAQYPVGWLADRFDRRRVLIALSCAAILACGLSAWVTTALMTLIASALFGFITFPIYSVSAAHAHDFATSEQRAELSAALLFFYAVGAISSPIVVARLIDVAGPVSFFAFIACGHLALVAYGLFRMTFNRTARVRTRYVYAPRTSFLIGKLLRNKRDDR